MFQLDLRTPNPQLTAPLKMKTPKFISHPAFESLQTSARRCALLLLLGTLGALFAGQCVRGATITWSGGVGGTWSTSTNWSPNSAPAGNDIVFGATGTAAAGTETNEVNSNVSIDSLIFTGTSTSITPYTTLIDSGITLSSTGAISTALNIGSSSVTGTNYVTFTGLGGLAVTGGASAGINVGASGSAITGVQTLDMSGLAYFTANVGNFLVGDATGSLATVETGTVLLAGSNSITATTISVGSAANSTGANGTGGTSSLSLGGTNTIIATTINIGAGKNPGSLQFEPSLNGAIVAIGGPAGAGATLNVGINGVSTSGTPVSTVDFSGGTLSGTFGTITLGRGAGSASAGTGTGSLTFGPGTLTAASIVSGTGGSSSNSAALGIGNVTMTANAGALTGTTVTLGAGSTTTGATGTFTQNGGTANITTLTLGNRIAGTVTATYNLAGGTLKAATIQAGAGTATRTFNWTGGNIENLAGNNLTVGTGLTLTLSGAGSQTFLADAGQTITVSGTIAGTSGFSSSGLGTLVLGSSNSYNGQTTITSGTVKLAQTYAAQNSTVAVNVDNGLAFGTGITAATIGGLSGSNLVNLINDDSNPVTLSVGNNNSSNTFSGVLSGAGGALNKVGSGSLTLTASSSYTGSTTISSGTLQLGNGGTTGAISSSSNITDNGVLVINRSNTVTQGTDFGGGAIGGTGALTLLGGGTLVLNAANTYSGATTVTSGTLDLLNQLAIQNSTLTMNGGGLIFDQSVSGNAFTFGGLAATTSGTGFDIALQNNAGTPAAVALTVGGNNANTTYAAVLSGSGSLIKVGTGSLTLTAANTYTGSTTFAGGNVTVGTGGAVGPALGSGTLTFQSGTLTTSYNSSAFASLNQNIFVGAGQSGVINLSQRINLSGSLLGSGTLTLNNPTSPAVERVFLQGNWTGFAGTANFNGTNSGGSDFTLQVNGGSFGAGLPNATVNLLGTAQLQPVDDSVGDTYQFGMLTGGTGTGILAPTQGGAATISVGGLGTSGTFAGSIGSTTNIAKTGAGAWTLSGSNGYTGTTTVSGGQLIVSGSITGSGAVTVNANSTLAGYGTIDGATTIAKNGTLAPAAGALTTGTMTLGNNLTLSGTSTVALNLNPSGALIDFLAVTGTLSIGTNDTLTVALLNSATAGQTFEFATGGTITGTFANVVLTGANSGSLTGTIDYSQEPSGILTLDLAVAVPEPQTWAMLLCGAATLVCVNRRRSALRKN
jgi:autotransporter-associated beta strand protein